MLRVLTTVLSIATLLLPSLLFPTSTPACGDEPPRTLLSLYRSSTGIYAGRYAKTVEGDVVETGDGYKKLAVYKHFDIEATLKGTPHKMLLLTDKEYRFENVTVAGEEDSVTSTSVEEPEIDSPFTAHHLNPGDRVLVFTKDDPSVKGSVVPVHYRDSIKLMNSERLNAYAARIRELNSLFAEGQPTDEAIVAWLVEAARDPITRWEAVTELSNSFDAVEWEEDEKKREAESNAEIAEGSGGGPEPVEEAPSEEGAVDESGDGEGEDGTDHSFRAEYARLLTSAQKETLLSYLLEARGEAGAKFSAGDRVLINIAAKWGEQRLARFMVNAIRVSEHDPYFVHQLMADTNKILIDTDLKAIAEQFGELYYQDADKTVGEEKSEEVDRVTIYEPVSTTAPVPAAGAEAEEKPGITYGELRADLTAKFLMRAEEVIQLLEDAKKGHATK